MPESSVAFRMPARISRGGRVTVAAVVEFSETGLSFESTSLCPPGEEITVSVDTDAGTFELPAKTEWWRMEPFATFEQMRFSNGCALASPTAAWRQWVEQTRSGMTG